MIWGRSRCLAVSPTPSCLLSTLRVSPSMLAVRFIPVIFMSHVIKRVKSSAFSPCFFPPTTSWTELMGLDETLQRWWWSSKVITVWCFSPDLCVYFGWKHAYRCGGLKLPTGHQTAVNIYTQKHWCSVFIYHTKEANMTLSGEWNRRLGKVH